MPKTQPLVLFVLLTLSLSTVVCAQKKQKTYPPKMEGAEVEIYKTVDGHELNMYIFQPENYADSDQRPAIVFFFGGGWAGGSPQQFEQHCLYFASRGMVAMTADYRVGNRQKTKAKECVMDGKSAVRWIRQNAKRLGVDPDRIVAGGGSAGGHVAACVATVTGFEQTGEDDTISSKPNALALFNPVLVLAPVEGQPPVSEAKMKRIEAMAARMGTEPENLSPYHQLVAGLPPTIIFHGKADTTVPYETAALFSKRAAELGDKARLEGYDDQGHGFFNYDRAGGEMYQTTVLTLDRFLVDHGFLDGPSPESLQ